jgi:methyl-accepting chemotaxis protein
VIQGLATNIAEASAGVQDANIRAADMAGVSREIASDMTSVDTVTAEIRSGGQQVQTSAAELSVLAEKLKSLVDLFRI